jgi:hypothetical protein
VIVTGLYLNGAKWDKDRGQLADIDDISLYKKIPNV